jgi:hypothetical protein
MSRFTLMRIESQPVKHVLLLGLTALMLAVSVPTAEAAVCAAGVYRAGCVGPNGAVVVRGPIHRRHGCYWRAGMRICR